MASDPRNLTRILNASGPGEAEANALLWPLIKDELNRIAHRFLLRERGNPILQTTMLVDEVFLKLIDQERVQWAGRAHFYAMAARMVRRTLVDWARGEKREKRGASWRRLDVEIESPSAENALCGDLLDLEQALAKLVESDPRPARVVELKFFAGLSVKEIACVLGVSERTVDGDWEFARTWLYREMRRGEIDAQRQGS